MNKLPFLDLIFLFQLGQPWHLGLYNWIISDDKTEKGRPGKEEKEEKDKQKHWDFELLDLIRIVRKQDYIDFLKGQNRLSFGYELTTIKSDTQPPMHVF